MVLVQVGHAGNHYTVCKNRLYPDNYLVALQPVFTSNSLTLGPLETTIQIGSDLKSNYAYVQLKNKSKDEVKIKKGDIIVKTSNLMTKEYIQKALQRKRSLSLSRSDMSKSPSRNFKESRLLGEIISSFMIATICSIRRMW